MSSSALEQCVSKMRAAGVNEACITQFSAQHTFVSEGGTGTIPEATLTEPQNLVFYDQLKEEDVNPEFLKETVVLKLNGGLATTMGLSKSKSLLCVKENDTFLDFICRQVLSVREQYQQPLKFMLMNSFSTSADTKAFLQEKYPSLAENYEEEVEVMQNKVPKILQEGLAPATYPEDPECEWVPPGHGDFYAALLGTGKLDKLLADGYKYMFVSNSDNLAATLDLKLLTEFAGKNHDFMIEFAERTEIDMKGSHLAQFKDSGRYLVRELNQCVAGEESDFRDITKHKYFNTNNMWINLIALKKAMNEHKGMLPLPVVRNKKTVCPTDLSTAKVLQLESAIGSAFSFFDKASAMVIPRTRFAPVKSCNDMLAVRSDCYVVTSDHRLVLAETRKGKPPVIILADQYYNFFNLMEKLTPNGTPSLVECERLEIKVPIAFEPSARIIGNVVIDSHPVSPTLRPKVDGEVKGNFFVGPSFPV